ncbi:hypothetical protein [Actinoplanes sp. NPDC049118]|uniref:deazapurine DNA modification protein DpdA family protein n=1 Tax=Actinoplanes sp. NPDC049118 TaxID=3155769 RepID=UPI0033DE3461
MSSTLDLASREQSARGAGSNTETIASVQFLLGTHMPSWLSRDHLDGPQSHPVPLFISDRRLRGYRSLPRAVTSWALDSGGFTELSTHGSWDHGPTPAQYVARIRRYRDEIGSLLWAAPQDWMCERRITAKTGLTIAEHHRRTVDNLLQLRSLADDLTIIPVVQGETPGDYLRCADLYARAGIDLTNEPLVGVGSVCRRQNTSEAGHILTALHGLGITRLHGFGFKILGLRRYSHLLNSADSMAWSIAARRESALPGCTGHINCANCPRYAYRWRQHATASRPHDRQPALFDWPIGAAR